MSVIETILTVMAPSAITAYATYKISVGRIKSEAGKTMAEAEKMIAEACKIRAEVENAPVEAFAIETEAAERIVSAAKTLINGLENRVAMLEAGDRVKSEQINELMRENIMLKEENERKGKEISRLEDRVRELERKKDELVEELKKEIGKSQADS